MGVTNGPSKLGTFSNDVLKLELSGPDCDHLTLIDVPGRRQALTLGWHIVRNPGQSEIGLDSATRNANESSFFKSHPWSSIDSDKTGVTSLRTRLQEVLKLHVRREFPKVSMPKYRQLSAAINIAIGS